MIFFHGNSSKKPYNPAMR